MMMNPKLDFSIFDRTDMHTCLQIAQIGQLRTNTDESTVLLRGFKGGKGSRQLEQVSAAVGRAVTFFKLQGINLIDEMIDQDTIKNILRFGPTEYVDSLFEGDIHLFTAHFHEGNIAKTGSWNMPNILSNLDRLKCHLGNLMGEKNSCPVNRQGKIEVYELMADYCLPTESITLPLEGAWTGLNETEQNKVRQ
jgi:hypothetical protein